ESPSQSWNRIRPSVVSASKSGAVSPIWRATFEFPLFRIGDGTSWPSILSQDQLALHEANGKAPGEEREGEQEGEVAEVRPAQCQEHRVAHELDAVIQRVDLAEHL